MKNSLLAKAKRRKRLRPEGRGFFDSQLVLQATLREEYARGGVGRRD